MSDVAPTVRYDDEWLELGDGERARRLAAVWLRHSAPSGRHRAGGQRTFDINDAPNPIHLDGVEVEGDVVTIRFSDGLVDAFSLDDLAAVAHPVSTKRLWDHSFDPDLATHDFNAVASDPSELHGWCVDLRDLGVARLRGGPTLPSTVIDVVGWFGFVRETNYGTTFDVRIEDDPNNLAFTSVEIGPHTDNPYRNPVPGIQLLHCVRNDSVGGRTRLTDGFAAVARLAAIAPDSYELLCRVPVTFEFCDPPLAHLRASAPLIEIDGHGTVVGVRYNSRSVEPFELDASDIVDFYDAYRDLGRVYRDPDFTIELQLQPGEVLAFDNRRVLHGRSAFVGPRHLVGCYADHDALESTIRVLEVSVER